MGRKRAANHVIGNAIIWAAMIIALSLLVGDAERSSMMTMLMVSGWFTTHLMLSDSRQAVQRECAAFRRLFSR